MSDNLSTRILLASRPSGWPVPGNFEVRTETLPELEPGQVRVRNEFLSVDPYMRGRMNDTRSYVAPYPIGGQITGGAIGQVIASADESMPAGTLVLHQHGWSDTVQAAADSFRAVPQLDGVPNSLRLHMMGMTGLTAYVGLTVIAQLAEGDTVFISGAAGAVGTAAGQIARLLGARRVIGSAGSAEKVALLTGKYGYDAALNYRDGDVAGQLAALAPEGIDVFFDNVGGEHLEAALENFNDGGRAALCGAISGYNTTQAQAGPGNMANLITRSLKLQGFTVGGYLRYSAEFSERMAGWFAAGQIAYDETIVEGIGNTVGAFIRMMQGANTGKMLVRI